MRKLLLILMVVFTFYSNSFALPSSSSGEECSVKSLSFASPDSKEAYSHLLKVCSLQNEKATRTLLLQGKAFLLKAGTKVLIVDVNIGTRSILILSGVHKGKRMRIAKNFLKCN